jgi:4-hydroxybenzoate polyprenyltransferase
LKNIIKLIRLPNLIIILLSQVLVRASLIFPEEPLTSVLEENFLLLLFTTFCVAAAGYIINDYYDIKIDVINKPQRVVVGKEMPRRQAILAHLFLTGTGVLVATVLSWRVGAIHLGAALLLWGYSAHLKRIFLVGNVVISLLGAVMLLVVAVQARQDNLAVWAFAVFAFIISLIREIIKDMEDVRGDASFARRTVPIVLGIPKTKWVLYFFLLCFHSFVLAAIVNRLPENPWFSGYMMVFVQFPGIWLWYRLHQSHRKKDFTWLSLTCKGIMLAGILSMTLLFWA